MTSPRREHARYDELAAGYALHALDPRDAAEFDAHLTGCPRCLDSLDRFLEVTAALAETCPPAEPAPALAHRIMAAVSALPPAAALPASPDGADPIQADAGPADLVPAGIRRPAPASHRRSGGRRPLRVAAAGIAAAAALIAGGATVAGLSGGGPAGPVPPAANCARASTCREVVLTAAGSHAPAARLIIEGGTAWLVPSGLPADNRSRQVYVLWQITGAHTPLAVGSFDVRGHGGTPVRVGPLAVPYRGTWAFAVSLEHGRTIPATPSRPVALGPVPS